MSGVTALVGGVFLAALLAASVADARVGGGGSSGSRGSRSYSAPRSPSTPTGPAAPASLAPAPPRTGGLFGGLGGMLGGLLLGGLLGSLLFGRGFGGGGIGLLEILIVAGLAYLAISFLRRREPVPATPAGSPSWPAGEKPEGEGGVTVAAVDDDIERGIAAIRMMDRGFDPARLTEIAADLFRRLQIGWSAGDLASVRAHLTDEMAVALEADLSRLRSQRRVNRVENVSVESATLTEAWQEYGRDLVTVRLRASALDYTLDETTGAVVDGSSTAPTSFEEFWTFVRPVGPNSWRLSAIQQPPA